MLDNHTTWTVSIFCPVRKFTDLGWGRTRHLRRTKPDPNQVRHPDGVIVKSSDASIAFFQRASSKRLIEDGIVNDCDINNFEDIQEEKNSLRADKTYAGIQLSNK
ncbi:hypothetical protein TNCV_1034451 [Trichonephila clavipes]|nr:hypothetical protein TNCV_1034451 [Trichonephila clavipes]